MPKRTRSGRRGPFLGWPTIVATAGWWLVVVLLVVRLVRPVHGFLWLFGKNALLVRSHEFRLGPSRILAAPPPIVDAATTTTIVTTQASLNERLYQNNTELLSIQGCLVAQRRFGSSFGFLDIQCTGLPQQQPGHNIIQVMVKRQNYTGRYFDEIWDGLSIGCGVNVTGHAASTRNRDEALLLAHVIRILQLPRNPQHVHKLLKIVSQLEQPEIVFDLSRLDQSVRQELVSGKNQSGLYQLARSVVETMPVQPNDSEMALSQTEDRAPLPAAPVGLQQVPEAVTIPAPVWKDEPIDSVTSLSDVRSRKDGDTVELNAVWIQNRRRFDNAISILELSSHYESANAIHDDALSLRVKSVLHPTLFARAALYNPMLAPGTRVRVFGTMHHECLWIHDIQIQQSSWRPSVILYMMERLHEQDWDVYAASDALNVAPNVLQSITAMSLTERQWHANQISATLQSETSRMAVVQQEELAILAAYQPVRELYPIVPSSNATVLTNPLQGRNRSTEGSRWKRKKEPQLLWMTRQVEDLIQSHPKYQTSDQYTPIRILDIGGGQGFLANCLAERLQNSVEITVVDIAKGAIRNGRMRSLRRNLHDRVSYQVADASQVQYPDNSFDIVVALHACGSLTDVALAHAVSQQASFVVCPCCFCSLSYLKMPYSLVPAEEWLQVNATDYCILRRLAEVQGDRALVSQAMHSVCALRVRAVEQFYSQVEIRTFPLAYSTRNFCLVGI